MLGELGVHLLTTPMCGPYPRWGCHVASVSESCVSSESELGDLLPSFVGVSLSVGVNGLPGVEVESAPSLGVVTGSEMGLWPIPVAVGSCPAMGAGSCSAGCVWSSSVAGWASVTSTSMVGWESTGSAGTGRPEAEPMAARVWVWVVLPDLSSNFTSPSS
jgi:hypothetical protein